MASIFNMLMARLKHSIWWATPALPEPIFSWKNRENSFICKIDQVTKYKSIILIIEDKLALLFFTLCPNLYLFNFLLYALLPFASNAALLLAFVKFSALINVCLQGTQWSFAPIIDYFLLVNNILIVLCIFIRFLWTFTYIFRWISLIWLFHYFWASRRNLFPFH